MLNNPKKDNKIRRGAKIEVENKVNINDVTVPEDYLKTSNIVRVTLPINIRVDNHIRNSIASLINLGKFDSSKEFVQYALDKYIEKELSPEDLKRFEYIRDTLEIKDFEKANKKKGK